MATRIRPSSVKFSVVCERVDKNINFGYKLEQVKLFR